MWFNCLAVFGLAALGQTLLLGAMLDSFDEDPAFVSDWTYFLPTIFYLFVAVCVVLSRFYRAALYTSKARASSAVIPNELVLDPVGRARDALQHRRTAWIAFVDASFDAVLLGLAITCTAMVIHELDVAQEGLEPFSFVNASIPLVIIWALLTLVAFVAAWRTNAAHSRHTGSGASGSLCGCCCTGVDESDGGYRAGAVQEKRVFIANANHEQWPCAFMFTWSLSYGWPDSVLALLLFTLLPAMIVVTVMYANFLDTGAPSMTSTFIILWIFEGLILVFAVLTAVWMFCCAWMPHSAPAGRIGYMPKLAELFAVILGTILLVVQQILIAVRVDDSDPIDWNVVFIPFYVFFALIALVGCTFGFCCFGRRSPSLSAHPCANDYDDPRNSTSAWGLVD